MRYPGGKKRMAPKIMAHIAPLLVDATSYIEPFCGSAAVAFEVLEHQHAPSSVWLNDKDRGVHAYWQAVFLYTEALCERIRAFKPSVDEFFRLRDLDDRCETILDQAFNKLALHAMSFGGLGPMAGSPIGGREQKSPYGVGCRWSPNKIVKDIIKQSALLRACAQTMVTCVDYKQTLANATPSTVIYLDPPYVGAGPALYKHAFTYQDHDDLCDVLRRCSARWVLSYDDHPEVRRRYSWARIRSIAGTTQRGGKASQERRKYELLISPA